MRTPIAQRTTTIGKNKVECSLRNTLIQFTQTYFSSV
uniref:Uncharacterized protein n=1 Tax=Anguilla anguilla TaxID=7936 RepID=A0A0E9U9T9_ANGAN